MAYLETKKHQDTCFATSNSSGLAGDGRIYTRLLHVTTIHKEVSKCTLYKFFYGFIAIRKKAFGFGGRKLFLMARFFKLLTTKFSSPAWTLGQSSKALQWFQSYLSDRYQSISVTNSSLPPSVLGPIVFVAYTTPHSDGIANHSIHH